MFKGSKKSRIWPLAEINKTMKYLNSYRSFNLITEAVEGTEIATPTGQPAGATVLSCQFNGQPVTDTKSTLTIPGLKRLLAQA